jgi:hypothetical protein
MTIASAWYDNRAEVQREFEMHFKVARRGSIRNVRRTLARRGVPYFQQSIYRKYRKWVRRGKIRVSFEREEPAAKVQRDIIITTRGMQYRGREWKPTALPTRVLSYAKKKRKRKSSKRKRP